ncbi:MAG: DUF11 domain-containing protein, partial [Anaerolineaceae bacterium]|nr:DUF11 domain-containing protein [Anaerolineaceae bacterium]
MITITNIGGIDLTNVILRDQLDPEIGWTQNNTQCTISDIGQLYCEFGTLPKGNSISVHISTTSTPAMCGTMTNIAEATADQVVASADIASINILCKPNVVLKKTEENPSIVPGDTARYTLEVKNIGTGTADGVVLTDNLPYSAGLAWTVDSVTGGGSCQINNFVLSCDFGSLPASEVRTVVVSTPTTAASCGDITNDAAVIATNESATEQNDNHDSATITVYCTSLKVEKLADAELVKANDPIGFQLTVTNIGSSEAVNVVLTDPLPANVTWSEDSTVCSIDSGTNVLSCAFGDLAVNGSASVHVTGMSNAAVCGTMTNTATGKADNITTESKDTASIIIECEPKLSIRKISEEREVAAGEPVVFTMTINNTGSGDAENVTLTDPLPPNPDLTWSFDNVTAGGSCAIDAGVLTCSYGILPAGQSASVRVSAISTLQTCGSLVNTVTAQGSNTSIVTDIAQITVNCGAAVNVTKVPELAEIKAGDSSQPARFIITVTSFGAETANNVELTDPLTSINDLAWQIDSVTGGGSCEIANGSLKCSFGDLASGQERVITISSQTSQVRFCRSDANRTIENYVTVTATNESEDDVYDNIAYAKIDVLCSSGTCDAPDEVYFNDFNSNTSGSAFWSTYPITTSPNGTQTFLGEFSNYDLRFTYPDTNPIGHQMIKVSFDLYVIKSWDGNVVRFNNHPTIVGPDHWQFRLLNEAGAVTRTYIDTTFTNYSEPKFQVFTQAYPGNYPGMNYPAGLGSSAMFTLGYVFGGPRDGIYHIVYYIRHTDPNVKLSFKALGLQSIYDENWGIDNFELRLMRCNAEFSMQNFNYIPALSNVNAPTSPLLSQDVRTEDK